MTGAGPRSLLHAAVLAAVAAIAIPACRGDDPENAPYVLVWADEFDGAADTPPDPARWTHEIGGDGWGNQELQLYTDRTDNAALDGAGHLVITARREDLGGRSFTSARLTTRGKFEQQYGRFEARLRLPPGKGMWPAFWLLGAAAADGGEAGWPARGEIDVVEGRGAQPWRVSGAVHGPGYSGGNALIAGYEAAGRADLTADFHDFAVEWDPGELRFFVDGQQYHTVRSSRLPTTGRWVFDHAFFLIMNLAVGGNFGGAPDATTVFPAVLVADHVRVYQRDGAAALGR
jgi:beta-glucanase (GH16 family)